jgi:hypothetical protein
MSLVLLPLPLQAFYYESWIKRNNMVREDEVVAGMPRFLRSGLLRPLTSGLVARVHYLPTCEAVVRGLVAESLVPVDVMPGGWGGGEETGGRGKGGAL